jgi:hypothetical protein
MAVGASEQKAIVNMVERWLALNADADCATLTVRIQPDGVSVSVKERRRIPVIPVPAAPEAT